MLNIGFRLKSWIVHTALLLISLCILIFSLAPTGPPNGVVKSYIKSILESDERTAGSQWQTLSQPQRQLLEEAITQRLLLDRRSISYRLGKVNFFNDGGEVAKLGLFGAIRAEVNADLWIQGQHFPISFILEKAPRPGLWAYAYPYLDCWRIADLTGLDDYVALTLYRDNIIPVANIQNASKIEPLYPTYILWDRQKTVAYAVNNALEDRAQSLKLSYDGVNFVSHALRAGGIPLRKPGADPSGWWWLEKHGNDWDYSLSWVRPGPFLQQVRSWGGTEVASVRELRLGDLIFYRWKSSDSWQHVAMVTNFAEDGTPLISSHSGDFLNQPWSMTHVDKGITDWLFIRLPDLIVPPPSPILSLPAEGEKL